MNLLSVSPTSSDLEYQKVFFKQMISQTAP